MAGPYAPVAQIVKRGRPQLKLAYGPQDHTGFDSVYYSVVRQGYAVTFSDWKDLKRAPSR